jgi:colanic acid biosynthesis glycosyl transferase WcaI
VRRRPRVLVFNQYYQPGVEATAKLLTELCVALAADLDVTVVTGNVPGAGFGRSLQDGVEVVRVRSTAFDRSHLGRRAANYFSYLAQALKVGVTRPRPDVVLCMTDPPMVADVALLVARRFGVPLVVVVQDVFPEVAVVLKRLENRVAVALLGALVETYLRRTDRVVAIGETMRERLVAKGADPERITVIPNWIDTARLVPHPRDNAWADEHGLVGRFVVMHSGNVGHTQDLDALIRASTFLRDLDDLVVAVIGSGARHAELVALAERLEADAVRFLPHQLYEVLGLSLSSADLHVVGLARGLSGYVVPSRVNGVLSVGRPLIVAAEADSESAQLVERIGCGIVVPPGRPELLAWEIRRAYEGAYDLAEMGRRGREYVESNADRSVALARYRELVGELL